jgi:RNA polymerase sigma-70 factor (ECF subfamily)
MKPRDPDPTADALLVVRCQLGEPAAFDALAARWHRPFWSYLRRLADHDAAAEEAVQETWVRVLRGLPRLREPERFATWAFTIARRVALDQLRVRYAAPPDAHLDPEALEETDDDETELKTDLMALRHGLMRLPPPPREVLTLFYLRELSLADVAEILEIPVGTVKSRLFQARRRLRAELDGE